MAKQATADELSAFQRDILAAVPVAESMPHADETRPHGQHVADQLGVWGKRPSNGRLYQNLADLEEGGYLRRDAIDGRSEALELTDDGWHILTRVSRRTEEALSERGVAAIEVE